ncbi:MAG: DUF3256 family protein [Muribaculaceae bacterium]|nr:DUF3256 family protein [Muribaculaceae bacterium]MDE5712099.1 DUF3256 family protein [Muribaculaceae bacterium]
MMPVLRIMAVMAFAVFAVFPCLAAEGDDSKKEFEVRDLFVELQSPALEILKKTTRLDMLDYWDADSVYKATNAMEGLSWLESVTPGYLKVRVTPVSTLELKVLPVKKGKVVMSVYTVGGESQAEDSQIDFYDENGSHLDTGKYFSAPDLSRFFDIPKGSLTSMKEIREMIPFPTVAYGASADSDSLSARLTVGEYMDVDNYNIIKLFLKPEISLEWKGKYK